MKDFFITLYSNENFPIYLGLFIVVLVIAFVVVYYWGKKDQKLIETRKLEKINTESDSFKETTKPKKVEAPVEDTIELPKVKDSKDITEDIPEADMPKRKDDSSFEYTRTIELPKLNSESGAKTVNLEDFDLLASSIDKEITSLENYQKEQKKAQDNIENLYEDTQEIELPKLK